MNVERHIEINASVPEVWQLISTQEGMRQWFGSDIQIDMRVGGRYRLMNPEQNQVISGEVLELISPSVLKLSWFEEDSDWVNPTQVTFRLEETSGGTRVHVTHAGFDSIGKQGWQRTYEEYQKGWTRHRLLENLKTRAEA